MVAHARRKRAACTRMRVYDRCMVRKFASFAFGLALILVLGFAMAHAQPLKGPGDSTGFSTSCELASPAFKATSESRAVSPIDSIFARENAGTPTGVLGQSFAAVVSWSIPPQASGFYPPLLHRPPPTA